MLWNNITIEPYPHQICKESGALYVHPNKIIVPLKWKSKNNIMIDYVTEFFKNMCTEMCNAVEPS